MDPFWRCWDARIPFGISGLFNIENLWNQREKGADWIVGYFGDYTYMNI